MSKFISIGQAAKYLGMSVSTLRRWEEEGRLLPHERSAGGQRRYDLTKLRPELFHAQEKEIQASQSQRSSGASL